MYRLVPLGNGRFGVDVLEGTRLLLIRGFPNLQAALHFTENFNPDDRNVDGSWTR